jgi:hypothetical protein
MEKARCLKCGQEVELGKMLGEENLIGIPDHEVMVTSRWFHAVCPICGPIMSYTRGHHGTIASKQLKALFPKAQLKSLRAELPEDKRKLFNETLRKRVAKDGEVQRWIEVLNRVSASANHKAKNKGRGA